jgi:hypothetical protein
MQRAARVEVQVALVSAAAQAAPVSEVVQVAQVRG